MKRSFLIIEDDEFDKEILEDILKKTLSLVHKVVWANRLMSSERLLEKESFDAIFLDVNLPDSISVENSIEELIKLQPHIPIIVMTGMEVPDAGVKAIKAGAEDYLVKGNFSAKELKTSLNYAINRSILKRNLYKSSKELDQFSYMASHDLKTPLKNILSFSEIIKEDLASENFNEIHSHATIIENEGLKMLNLIDDLFHYCRAGLGIQQPVEVKPIEVFKQQVDNFKKNEKFPKFNVKIHGASEKMIIDISAMEKIFSNLLENSLKYYKDPNNITIELTLNRDHDESYIFKYEDNGVGIAEDKFQTIFLPFKRLDINFSGTGMGLSIVKRLVEACDGTIAINSRVGEYTEFIFKLPSASSTQKDDA